MLVLTTILSAEIFGIEKKIDLAQNENDLKWEVFIYKYF
jgi:hypothetical protein